MKKIIGILALSIGAVSFAFADNMMKQNDAKSAGSSMEKKAHKHTKHKSHHKAHKHHKKHKAE